MEPNRLPVTPALALTHVCQYWRHLARCDPSLWTIPDFQRPQLAWKMLELVQDMPLSVHLRYSHDTEPIGPVKEVQAEAIRRPDKIKNLHISSSSRDDIPELDGITGPMPLLESLRIVQPKHVTRNVYLRSSFFKHGVFPLLRSVTLLHCILPRTANCLTSLTSLTLNLSSLVDHFHDVMDILRRNATLQYLNLANLLGDRTPPSEYYPTDSVHLPYLKKLTLREDYFQALIPLTVIQAPKLSSLDLRLWSENDYRYDAPTAIMIADPAFSDFCSRLKTFFALRSLSPETAEVACTGSPVGFFTDALDCRLAVSCICRVLVGKDGVVDDKDTETFEFKLRFEKYCADDNPGPVDFLSDFLQHFPTPHLRLLTVHYGVDRCDIIRPQQFNQGRLWRLLSTQPSLESLSLEGFRSLGIPADLLEHLAPSTVANESEHSTDIRQGFPTLKSLSYGANTICPIQKRLQERIEALSSMSRRRVEADITPPLSIELHQVMVGKSVQVHIAGCEMMLEEHKRTFPSTDHPRL